MISALCIWAAVVFGVLFLFTGGSGFLLLFFFALAAHILTKEDD